MAKCCLNASALIETSSKLLVTRSGIKARTSLISGRIRLLILELLVLEWRKFYTFELEYLWGQSANLDQILCVATLGMGKGCIMFWGRLDKNSGVYGNRNPPLSYNGENGVSTGPLTTELAALECLKNCHRLKMGKWCLHASSFIFDRIIIKVAGTQDRHKSSDEFDFGRASGFYGPFICFFFF